MPKIIVMGTAGSGKTYLLTESVSRLLEGEEPKADGQDILILTSSPRAGSRIRSGLKDTRASLIVVHTIRSLCQEALRESNPEFRFLSDFRAWFMLREHIRGGAAPIQSSYARISGKHSFVRELLELIEAASINSIPVDQLPGADQAADKLEDIKNIYGYYKNFCQQHNLMPAFDTIPGALGLLSKYSERFSHIFIDQYEDLCPGEIQAVRSLIGGHASVTIFADAVRCAPDSLSELWPGDSENPPAPLYKGEKEDTYKGEKEDTRKIDVSEYAASLSISHVHHRLSPAMADHVNRFSGEVKYSQAEPGKRGQDDFAPGSGTLTITAEETAIDEAEYIARVIRRKGGKPGRSYSDFAILCRDVDRLGGIVRDALRKYSIPCSGGTNVSQDPLVRFILLSLQVAADPGEDDVVLKWLCSPISRLNRADVYRAYREARWGRQDLLAMISGEASTSRTSGSTESLFRESQQRLRELLPILDFIRSRLQSGGNIRELVEPILAMSGAMDSGNMPALPGVVMVLFEVIRDIEETYQKRPRLSRILDDIRDGLARISSSIELADEDGDSVRIMSIREARGLEFAFVFVPGMVSNFFPARHPARQLLYGEDLEPTRAALRGIDLPGTISSERWGQQERQLFYIAMTRAKEELYLTLARQYPENENSEPSPLLAELLGGREVSAENCDRYGISYQERSVSSSSMGLPSLDNIASRAELDVACYQYIKELERLDQKKAEEAIEILTSTGMPGELVLPERMKDVPIPQSSSTSFNYTSIRCFLSCPRRYFLAHLLKAEVDYGPGAQFGRLVHKALGTFHHQYPVLNDYDLEGLWTEMRGILLGLWVGEPDTETGKDPNNPEKYAGYEAEFAGNRLQAGSYIRLAEEILDAYLRAEYERWDAARSCTHTEKKFSSTLFDRYSFGGRIDRIDACSQYGDEIIDFKTSAYDTDAESALKSKFLNMDDDPDYRPEDYQLPIYYMAGLDDPDQDPRKLVIYQLRNFSKRTGAPFRREIEILPEDNERSGKKDKFITGADLECVKRDILRTLDAMLSGLYPPDPRDDNVCERECEFSFICDREEDDNQ